MASLKMFNQSL